MLGEWAETLSIPPADFVTAVDCDVGCTCDTMTSHIPPWLELTKLVEVKSDGVVFFVANRYDDFEEIVDTVYVKNYDHYTP